MSFGLLRTLGPVNDTANDATIAYTLKTGELLRVGETIIIAVGSAGSGGAWVLSAADTQGNSYTVDAIDSATGGALAGVVSCQATTALGPGDTITITLNTACTTKRFFARIVNGGAVVSRVDVSGANGLGGAGNTVPTVTTGLVDGAGTPSPTTDPDDYAFVVTVWNGTTVLTEDSQLSELNSGHFDNPAATQVKQMAVAERQLTTAAIKTFTGSLANSQQWAMVVVTYKPQAASASNTLGPNHATGPANTISYTLAAGESIPVGSTAIVHVGAAGAAGAVVASIADTQGNAYTVDDSTQNGTGAGGAAASIGSGLIQTALHSGDTITATYVGSPPNRNIVIRIVSGLVSVNRVDQTSTESTTGTSPTVTTGIEDGVGAGTPTSQGAEYGAVCLVWDAGATLTEDAALTSVWKGHFDYAGGAQTKQMAVSEHQFTTASIKTFTDNLGAAQAYAMVLVTYRINVSNPSTLKPAPSGLSGRDLTAPPAGYQGSYSNIMFDVYWDNLQPTKADGVTPVNENALDATEVARIKGILDHLHSLTAPDGGKYTGSIRLFAGYRSPKWLASRVGTFHYKDPANPNNKVVTVPKFWTTAFKNSWANMQQLLAAQFDNHPALSMLQLANAMTYYAEELIRHTSASANIAEMVGGGHSWDVATGTPTGPIVQAPGAGYSDAANQTAIKFGIDTHKTYWANTAASISFNPYDKILSETEAQAVQPGIQYGSPLDNQIVSTDDPNLTITKRLIDYHVSQLFPTNQCALENNSVRKSYFTAGGALITTTKMGIMYAYMVSKGVPLYYQMAGTHDVPDSDFNFVIGACVNALNANAVEPTRPKGLSPYDATNLAKWDAALRANPIPGSGGGGGTGGGVATTFGATTGQGAGNAHATPDLAGWTSFQTKSGTFANCIKLFGVNGYPNLWTTFAGVPASLASNNGGHPVLFLVPFDNVPTAADFETLLATLPTGQKLAFTYQSEVENGPVMTGPQFVADCHTISQNLNTALAYMAAHPAAGNAGGFYTRANFPFMNSAYMAYYSANPGSTSYIPNLADVDAYGADLYHKGPATNSVCTSDSRFAGYVAAVHAKVGTNVAFAFTEYGIDLNGIASDAARAQLMASDYAAMTGTGRPGQLGLLLWNYWFEVGNSGEAYLFAPSTSPTAVEWQTLSSGGGGGGGGGNPHAPTPTAGPVVSIASGTGYTPTTVLQTDMGVFDGGTNGVAHYVVSWYRVDPATGLRTLVRGPTTYTSPSATDDYTLAVADIGDQIESEVIADNADGTSPANTSGLTPIIQSPSAGAPANTVLPSITPRSPQPGQVLSANHGAWTNGPTSYTYRFRISTDSGATWTVVQAYSADNTYQTKNDGTQDGAIFDVQVVANNGTPSPVATGQPTAPLSALPPVINPFGGPVDLPGYAYGENMPAWLRVDGIEIANWARTYEYLAAGLQGGDVTVYGPDCVCDQLYDPDSSGTDLVFIDPVTDAAPWVDPLRAESIQFLGLIVSGVQIAPQRGRTAVSQPGRFGGSVLSPVTSGGMVITVSGQLVAASKSGADYGIEWLRQVLQDPACDVCGTSTVEMRTSCPPDDGSDETLGYWLAYRAGLTADLVVGTQDVKGALTDVTWTWTSAEAYLYKQASQGFPPTILNPTPPGGPCIPFSDWLCGPGPSLGCYTVLPPTRGAWGTVITVTNSADGSVGQIVIDLYSSCPPDGAIPDSSLLVSGLDPGEQLVIDSSQHTVTRIDVDGNEWPGLDHIYVPAGQPLRWIEVLDCDPAKCVCIAAAHPCSGGRNTTVELDVQYRRRG